MEMEAPSLNRCHNCSKILTCSPGMILAQLHQSYPLLGFLSGASQELQRLSNAAKCQEAPRVALSKCQGYCRLAATSARKQRRKRRGRRRRKRRRRRVKTVRDWRVVELGGTGEGGYHLSLIVAISNPGREDADDHISVSATHSLDYTTPWYCGLTY